ncbi:MAG: AAA family ATPase [Anaerolineales bacterium]
MPDFDSSKFRIKKLNTDQLSTPFKVQTNWHVISGASSSGKTTVINLLNDMGFKTSPEPARLYLEQGVAQGHTIAEQRKDMRALNRAIMAYSLKLELDLPVDEVVFLDRGFPDCLSYCRLVGLDPNEFLPGCFHRRYATVFILDRLPFYHDGVRYEDDAIAEFLHQWTYKDYIALGYNVIRVPVLPPEERVAFILKKFSD